MLQLVHPGRDFVQSRNHSATVTPDISVVIVSFNTRELLRQCICILDREAVGLAYETVVVDNASEDGSADMIAAEFPDVNLIRSPVNLGFAAANNRAFRNVRGRYIVLLNPDAFVRPSALHNAIARMDATPRAGVGGGRLVGLDDSWQPSARMFPSLLNVFLAISGLAARFSDSRFLGRADRTWADPFQPSAVDWVPGAFSIVRRQALEQVGYFDERFFLYYEEIDLCRRIKAAGYEVWYWPDVVISHLGGQSSKTLTNFELSPTGSQVTLWRMRSELLFRRKHHGLFGAWAAMQLEVCWNLLRIQKHRLSRSHRAKQNTLRSQSIINQMTQAWRETRGGKVSPPRPW
jgi:GT2 family glycosyltransferase